MVKIEPSHIKIEPVQIKIDPMQHIKIESPQLSKMSDMDVIMEDSLDGGPPSVGSGEIPVVVPNTPVTTPVSTPAPTSKKVRKLIKI